MYHIIHQHQSVVLQWSHMDRERKLSFPPLFVQFVATAFLFSPNPSALQIGEYLLSLLDFLLYPPLSEQHDDIPASTVHPSSQPMNDVNSFFHLWLQIRCNLTKGLDDKWSNIFMDTEAPPHSISFLFSNPLLKITILAKMIILYLQVLFFFCTHSCLRCWTESPLFGLQSWCCFVWIFHLNPPASHTPSFPDLIGYHLQNGFISHLHILFYFAQWSPLQSMLHYFCLIFLFNTGQGIFPFGV